MKRRITVQPGQVFIGGFALLIFIGAFLLSLPFATTKPLSIIDALFTSTSAVCVTGLTVVDTGTRFTTAGHTIIILLIQCGGLGILTFANYFVYFFRGGTSYVNQLGLMDLTNTEKFGEAFAMVKMILPITLLIEAVSALFLYLSLDPAQFTRVGERIWVSVFHAISAFCNAGFSILPEGLMNHKLQFNYSFQLILSLTLIFGGLGFPIVLNLLTYIKHSCSRVFYRLMGKQAHYKPWILSLNSRINLITTFSLVCVGTVLILFKEYEHALSMHHGVGKWASALFTATTPRTAGFNSIDFSTLHFSSILLVIFLMWVGASPNSTGGGIKTSTFAIAIINIISLVRGKPQVEVFNREISSVTIQRAFATLALSLLVIGIAVFLIAYFDPHVDLLPISFECFSAYSTVGLTLGITGSLSTASKGVLIITMFIGRVTMLTILVMLVKKAKHAFYKYPVEEITIT